MHQYVEQLEQSINSLHSNQQQILERLAEIFNKHSTFPTSFEKVEDSQAS
jgi:thiaminase